ncbi:lamin tail domain-containing protein [Rhodopirellula sp. MGV]|uniref:lamin tail domain-containing protein n=1 Tax=Rhodopirellula sp. MGV TaxID=2023130 RepID=UPI000B9739E4|nr:lamin tail domain-containing protein [Rhodopirellula sp. MGV]OYP37683.1 hypothetical protein CGZ80_04135 [Rhodopirellula sp. MGV]PNY37121.1 hypothetical protein C2E31_08990 [Rhodopirellula baltica]
MTISSKHLIAVLLAATVSFISPTTSQAAIVITEVMANSAHPGSGGTSNADWFEIYNNGTTTIDLTGWSWDDESEEAGTANFGSVTSLAAGQALIVTGEPEGTEASWLTDWGNPTVNLIHRDTFPGLGSGGDGLRLFDNTGALVYSVDFGVATEGVTFAYDSSGSYLGQSAEGVNGAFRATFDGAGGAGIDIGSPGFVVTAIPEPSSLAGCLILATGICCGRRKRSTVR